MIRRSPFSAFLLVGFGLVVGAALVGEGAAGGLLALPILAVGLVFKVMFFMLLIGFFMRVFGGRNHRHMSGTGAPPWMRQEFQKAWSEKGSRDEEPHASKSDRFEEWHRMAHAREEVDDYAPPVEE